MHVTQSALSGLIKELEQTLEAKVVDRSTRRIVLTDIGRELYPLFSQMIDDLDGALANVADHTRLKKGVVRIAAPQLLSCTLLPEVIAAFSQAHPDVQVRLADCEVDSVLARVASGEVDFGVGPERPTGADIAAQALFELPFMVVFPPGHALEPLPRIGWSDVVQHPFIALQGQFTELLTHDLHGALRDLTLRPSHEVAFMSTALSLVHAGQGITTCLPYADSLVKLYQLRMRPLLGPELRRKFQVYQRASATLAPAAAEFAQFLHAQVASRGWSASGQ